MGKERPILFSGPMVRAILEGRKTQTRRVMKHQPQRVTVPGVGPMLAIQQPRGKDRWLWPNAKDEVLASCPYGQPGDRLWVRETWAHYQTVDHARRSDGRSFSEVSDGLAGYRADGFESIEEFRDHIRLMGGLAREAVEINGDRWRPSIHMPRWACRLVLEVTDVRVERLQAISDTDAVAESCCSTGTIGRDWQGPVENFGALWASINDQDSWDSNPWVWVVAFRRVQP